MSLKHIVKSWVTTLVSIALFGITTYKVYFMFDTLSMSQALVILFMYILAGGLLFASDKFFKDSFGKLVNRVAK